MLYRYMCIAEVKKPRDFASDAKRTYTLETIQDNETDARVKFIEHIVNQERVSNETDLIYSMYINEMEKVYEMPKPKKKK